MPKPLKYAAVFVPLLLMTACGFVGTEPISALDPPGFFLGVWHGLLAPWTLIVRLFLDIKMYAVPNTGWFYDLGFLIGVLLSIPVGLWATIIALIVHIF
jgi:hypothetical protein